MALRTPLTAALVLLLAVTAFSRPGVAQVPSPAAQPSQTIVVTTSVGQNGTRYQYEITQERADALPQWDQRSTPEPLLSMSSARKAAETWLMSRTPEIKTFELISLTFLRLVPRGVPLGNCSVGCWYYRMSFSPVVGGRRLNGGGDFTVVVLLDGSIVEPLVEDVPATASGAGRGGPGGGGPGGPGSGTGGGGGPRSGAGQSPVSSGATSGGTGTVYRPGSDVTSPQVVRQVKTQYTDAAMRAKIQGNVLLEAVVNADGTVGDVRVVRSLDLVYGLDEAAVKAARQWRFRPGTRMGVPVPVLVTLEMTFSLR